MGDTATNSDVSVSNAMNVANGQLQEIGGNPAAQQEQQQQQQGFSGWAMFKTMLVRMLVIYLITSFLRRPSQPANGGQLAQTVMPASNVIAKDALLDLFVYVSESKDTVKDFLHPFWLHEGLRYGDYTEGPSQDGVYTFSGSIPISEAVQNNGSLYIHSYFVQSGYSPDPKSGENYSKRHTIYKTKQLNKFKKRKYHTMKNLLTGTTAVQPDLVRMENETTMEILSHWHPNVTINLVFDHTEWVNNQLPQPFDEYIEFLQGGLEYYPIVYYNDYWNLNSEYMPINSTTKELNLTITFYHMSILKWQMYAAQGMQRGWYSYLGEDLAESNDEDQDNLKQTILDTNPYLLALTIAVSLVHSVFEFLAFKNDIQFWRNRTTLEGLSVRSVFFNVFQSVIILLYVLDNDTNFVIRVSIFVGLLIEMWKIHKVIDIKLDRENKIFNLLPRIVFTDKSTYTQSHTKEYDMLAFKYLSILLFPLLVGYAVYSVLYQEHKGWYSWVLSMLYGFLLTFGFIAMTPQLFINYKLKSVAHLPWRMLTYKALNTFIDDLFAFVIRMPMLYRIGCFRDDIVFLIYVYQRWIYRVDPKRINEFGTCGDPTTEAQAIENRDVVDSEEGGANRLRDAPLVSNDSEEKKNN